MADLAIKAAMSERAVTSELSVNWLVADCSRAIQNFLAIKESTLNGSLQPSNKAELGISRALSEWNVSDNLYSAGYALED